MPDITKSLAMQNKAKSLIPGMTQLLSKRPDMFAPGVWPGFYSKAEGVKVWDLDGNEYTDMSISGIGANILGYADPDVNEAVKKAIDLGSSCSLNCTEEVELAELFCELHPWAEKARFARSGGEAMALAVRIARAYKCRDKIAFCGYHGWHDWYLATNLAVEDGLGQQCISGLEPRGVPKGLAGTALPFRYNHLEELEEIINTHGEEIAAVVMEPIRSTRPEPGFLEGAKALAHKVGAVFMFDEISSGFRMNTGGAHLLLGVEPDMAVFSKAMGNGYPIAAIIGKGDVMDATQSTFISSTMWTERVGSTAALATIKKFRDQNAGEHLTAIGRAAQEGWARLAEKHGLKIEIGGIEPTSHFGFENEHVHECRAYFVQLMLDQGYLAGTLLYAMLAHTQDHVEKYLTAVDSAFGEIADALAKGDIKDRMRGGPAGVGFKRLA